MYAIQSLDLPMELISQPAVDLTTSPAPYLPANPLDLLRTGEYSKAPATATPGRKADQSFF